MFEHKTQPLLKTHEFVRRMLASFAAAIGIVAVALVAGATGYRQTEGMPWLDAFLNASMILTGMGPVDRLLTTGGKVFAICYSLASGFVVLTVGALIMAPVLHRLLHAMHLESEGAE